MSSHQSQPQAEDPHDYNQRRRLASIGDARGMALEALLRTDAGVDTNGGESQQGESEQFAHSAVKAYAELLRWSIQNHGDDSYYQTRLGSVVITPPDELQRIADPRNHDQGQRIVGQPEIPAKEMPVVGLFAPTDTDTAGTAFVDLPAVIAADWTVHVDIRQIGPVDRTFTESVPVPPSVSWAAFNLCNKFLNKTGLDVRINDGRPFNNYSE